MQLQRRKELEQTAFEDLISPRCSLGVARDDPVANTNLAVIALTETLGPCSHMHLHSSLWTRRSHVQNVPIWRVTYPPSLVVVVTVNPCP